MIFTLNWSLMNKYNYIIEYVNDIYIYIYLCIHIRIMTFHTRIMTYIYIYTESLNTQWVYFVVVQSVISIFQECFTLFGSI